MTWAFYVLAMMIAFVILVTVHELGHLIVARLSGVAVLRFSVGFGRPIYRWVDRLGTEWVLGWIPFGGYVKMLDEREFEVPADMRHRTFNAASPPRRIAIASAGPVANLLLAFAAFWILMVVGTSHPVPIVDRPPENSPAMHAGFTSGEEILAIDGTPTPTWFHANLALVERLGESGTIQITVKSRGGEAVRLISIENWLRGSRDADLTRELGLVPSALPVIDRVIVDSRAEAAGLQAGDRVVSANGVPINTWTELSSAIASHPERTISVVVERGDGVAQLTMTPAQTAGPNGEPIGFAGVGVAVEQRLIRHGPVAAVPNALDETWNAIGLTVGVLWKMVRGDVSVENLAGPVTVAHVAGRAMEIGWLPFLKLLAFLSISLGIINLLPIPVLDGGHIAYALVEMISRRPVSPRIEMIASRAGMVLVGSLMMLALYSDFTRLFG